VNPIIIELDARGFEPPQPLMKTLEAVAELPEGAELRVHTRWRPALLYAELESRGLIGESQEQSDGSYITHIRRR
jgi:tRNA 2-thiouridine synthesizing protein A